MYIKFEYTYSESPYTPYTWRMRNKLVGFMARNLRTPPNSANRVKFTSCFGYKDRTPRNWVSAQINKTLSITHHSYATAPALENWIVRIVRVGNRMAIIHNDRSISEVVIIRKQSRCWWSITLRECTLKKVCKKPTDHQETGRWSSSSDSIRSIDYWVFIRVWYWSMCVISTHEPLRVRHAWSIAQMTCWSVHCLLAYIIKKTPQLQIHCLECLVLDTVYPHICIAAEYDKKNRIATKLIQPASSRNGGSQVWVSSDTCVQVWLGLPYKGHMFKIRT